VSADIMFSRIMLRQAREEAKRLGVEVPKGLTAIRSGAPSGGWWLVESRGGFREEVVAHNAFDAKVQAINRLIKGKEK